MAHVQAALKHKLDETEAKSAGLRANEDDVYEKRQKLDVTPKEHAPNKTAHHVLEKRGLLAEEPITDPSQYISEYLKSIPALSIMPEKGPDTVFKVHANHHAANALRVLTKENIMSCPVYDTELESYVGFVDYLDFTALAVNVIRGIMEKEFPDTESIDLLSQDDHDKLALLTKQEFNKKTLFDISDISELDPFIQIQKGASLYQAIEVLAKSGIHRVPIVNNGDDTIAAVLSQSTVINYLFKNLDKFSSKAKETVKECIEQQNVPVATIKEQAISFEAFELMLKNKITAVGVVDDDGKLTGVISSTDIRMIGPHAHSLSALARPAKDFFERSHEKNDITLVPLVVVTVDETLGIVIEKMQDNMVHRVFVVDEEGKPIGVLSMKDVLMKFL